MKNLLIILIVYSLLIAIVFSSSCCSKSAKVKKLEYLFSQNDRVTIPFQTITLLSKHDTIFHKGTFAMFDYWNDLEMHQNQPSEFRGFIELANGRFCSLLLQFNPYDLQLIFGLPIQIERSLIPLMKKDDPSMKNEKVTDNKLVFQTKRPAKYHLKKIWIIAKHDDKLFSQQ